MQISLFDSITQKTPRPLPITWNQVVEALSQPTYTPCAPCPRGNKCKHKSGELFSPVRYKLGTKRERGNASDNIDKVYFLVYDLDHLTNEELSDIGDKVEGFESFTYSSHSDAPELNDRCFRLLVNLSRPLTNPEWHRLYFAFAEHLGIKDLGGSKDISRMFYTPSTPEGSQFFTAIGAGEPLNVDAWLRTLPTEKSSTPTPSTPEPIDYEKFRAKVAEIAKKKARSDAPLQLKLAESYQNALDGKPLRTEGKRDEAVRDLVLSLLSIFGASHKDAIIYLLRPSCLAMGDDQPGRSYLSVMENQVDRTLDMGEASFQERLDRQLANASAALATLSKPEKVKYPETGDEVLDAFNKTFFLGWNAQKNQLCYWKETNDEVIPIGKDSIVTETRPIKKRIEDKAIPGFQYWESSTSRRHYDRVHFAPMIDLPPNEYNLFKGYGLESKDVDYPLFKEFWRNVICAGDDEIYRYQVTWVAQMLQRPYDLPGVALVLHSDIHGTGKGTFAEAIGRLLGKAHFVAEPDYAKVFKGFSGHLERAILVNIDESQSSPSRDLHDAMKHAITTPTRQIEHKGMTRFTCNNYAHYILTTNNKDSVRIDPSDRRFAVFGVSTHRVGDREYFTKLYKEIHSDAMCGLLKDLLEFDLEKDGVDLRNIPETQTRKAMRQTSISEVAVFWQNFLQVSRDSQCNLTDKHLEYTMTRPRNVASLAQFTHEIKELCPHGKESLLTLGSGRRVVFEFDPTRARKDFETVTRTKPIWLEETKEQLSKGWN